jgi:hypothetical protein
MPALIRDNVAVRASKTLPAGYVEAGSVVLAGNRRLIAAMNVSGLVVLVVSCGALGGLASVVRPELAAYEVTFPTLGAAMAALGLFAAGVVFTSILVLVLHEAVHGLVFWAYTRSRPRFGYAGWYAYATAPGWFFSRGQMLVVGLAPLVTISVATLATAWIAPVPLAVLLLLGTVVNAAGAVGDVYFSARLLALPSTAIVEDHHDRLTWYLPAPVTGASPGPSR